MRTLALIVCGKFHYDRYAHLLGRALSLKQVVFSHRLGAFSLLRREVRANIFLKEYLLAAHLRTIGEWGLQSLILHYHRVWEIGALLRYEPADINLFLLHGNCIPLIKKAKQRPGAIVVGEVVNAHPHDLFRRLQRAAAGVGLKQPRQNRLLADRLLTEARMADVLLAPSTAVADSYAAFGFPREKIFVLPYGMENPEAPPNVCKPRAGTNISIRRKSRVVCVGQVCIRKGQFQLATALARRPTADISLTLIGRPDPKYLDAVLKVNSSIEHMQHVPRAKMEEKLRSFDALVLPSVEDGFGVVVLEALSAGVPVIVSKYAGAAEVVQQYGGGLVVDPFDQDALINAIEKVLQGCFPPLTRSMPSWEDYSLGLEEFLLHYCRGGGAV